MKRVLPFLIVLFAASAVRAPAQSSVHEKDLNGTSWRMVFALEEGGDSALERLALRAVSGVLDAIDLQFHFLPDNKLKVTVSAFGEEEVEYSQWRINEKRELLIGDSEHFQADDTIWMFENGKLASYKYENGERVRSDEAMYLELIQ